MVIEMTTVAACRNQIDGRRNRQQDERSNQINLLEHLGKKPTLRNDQTGGVDFVATQLLISNNIDNLISESDLPCDGNLSARG